MLERILETKKFFIVDKGDLGLPIVAFALLDSSKYTVFDIQDFLKKNGWIVPAYRCPKGAQNLCIMRVVVKQNFSTDLADLLIESIINAVEYLEQNSSYKDLPSLKKRKIFHSKSRIQSTYENHKKSKSRTHGIC